MNAICISASTPQEADPAGRGVTVAERASSSLPTSEECTALAHAMAIRARAELVEIYARVYQRWSAAEQMMRDATQQIMRDATEHIMRDGTEHIMRDGTEHILRDGAAPPNATTTAA